MSTTNVDPASLPLDGNTFEETIPFGDTVLTLETNPRRHLGASLSQQLPWILLMTGLLLTATAALVAHQLVRGRRVAEGHTETITALYERVDSLYEEERALFVRLQRALLPQTNPQIPRIEMAAEYVAGTQGIDIGGDWYSVIAISDEEFAFVVGDVSGRGVDAVAVMAHARFTLRAYLVDGQSPSAALEKCSRQFDISVDGHMTTALVGVGNWRTGVVTLANAGHPAPLLLTEDRPEFVATPVGPPLGTGSSAYESCEFTMPVGSTLILYTDGLIERRTEDIATGMDRLARTVAPMSSVPLQTMVGEVLRGLNDPTASDDIARAGAAVGGAMKATLPGDLQAAAQARTFVASNLQEMAVGADVPVDDVLIVADELVTNAVQAGATSVEVKLRTRAPPAGTCRRLMTRLVGRLRGWQPIATSTDEVLPSWRNCRTNGLSPVTRRARA